MVITEPTLTLARFPASTYGLGGVLFTFLDLLNPQGDQHLTNKLSLSYTDTPTLSLTPTHSLTNTYRC